MLEKNEAYSKHIPSFKIVKYHTKEQNTKSSVHV